MHYKLFCIIACCSYRYMCGQWGALGLYHVVATLQIKEKSADMSSWTHISLQHAASFRFKCVLIASTPPGCPFWIPPSRVLFCHLLSLFLLCPFYMLFVITAFTYLETALRCAVLPSEMSLSSWLVLIFPGNSVSADGIPRLFVCLYSYITVYNHFRRGSCKKNENETKDQYSIILPKPALMRQFELKIRTRSLKSALCTHCQTPTLLRGVHRIWTETLSHSKPQFLISKQGMAIPYIFIMRNKSEDVKRVKMSENCKHWLVIIINPILQMEHGEGNGNPLQYSCLENPVDRGVWQATVHVVAKSWTIERLNHHRWGN